MIVQSSSMILQLYDSSVQLNGTPSLWWFSPAQWYSSSMMVQSSSMIVQSSSMIRHLYDSSVQLNGTPSLWWFSPALWYSSSIMVQKLIQDIESWDLCGDWDVVLGHMGLQTNLSNCVRVSWHLWWWWFGVSWSLTDGGGGWGTHKDRQRCHDYLLSHVCEQAT